jgi:NAD(P)-dependent dehydrogenase (short-subunit alcohol dehydrogenase family)
MSFNRFPGKVALVTGGAQGIGRAAVTRLVSEGATGVVVDRNLEPAEQVARELQSAGGQAAAFQVDVRERRALDELVSKVVDQFGRIDLLVNSAGVHQSNPLFDIDESGWDRIMSINLRGLFFCSQAVARQMVEQGAGRIVNIASQGGKRPGLNSMHYGASKAGVISLTRSMALALAPHGINVNAVCPGYIDTPMSQHTEREVVSLGLFAEGEYRRQGIEGIPLKRTASPEEVAALVAFLASDEAAYMTGEAINFGGGSLMD